MSKNFTRSKCLHVLLILLLSFILQVPAYATGEASVNYLAYSWGNPWANEGANLGIVFNTTSGAQGTNYGILDVCVYPIGEQTYTFMIRKDVGIKVANTTNIQSPSYISFANTADETPYRMTKTPNDPIKMLAIRTEGTKVYLYTVADTWSDGTKNQIRKIDVTDPTKPVTTAYFDCVSGAYLRTLRVQGERIYSAGGGVNNGQLLIHDAYLTGGSDQLVPSTSRYGYAPLFSTTFSSSSQYDAIYNFDLQVKNGETYVIGTPYSVFNATATGTPTYFYVIKVTDPGGAGASITANVYRKDINTYFERTSTNTLSYLSLNRFNGVAVDGNYAYISVLDGANQNVLTECNDVILIFDISDPTSTDFQNPSHGVTVFDPNTTYQTVLTQWRSDLPGKFIKPANYLTYFRPAKGMKLVGKTLYMADLGQRLLAFDILESPTAPKLIQAYTNTGKNTPVIIDTITNLAVYKDNLYVTFAGSTYTNDSKTYYPDMQIIRSSAVQITSINENATITSLPFNVSGYAKGANEVTLTVGQNTPVQVLVDENGNFSYDVHGISNGIRQISASVVATNSVANATTTKQVTFNVPLTFSDKQYTVSGGQIHTSLTATNPTGEKKSVFLISALYKGNQMVRVSIQPYEIAIDAVNAPLAISIDATPKQGDQTLAGYKLSTYLWNNLDEMNPIEKSEWKDLPIN